LLDGGYFFGAGLDAPVDAAYEPIGIGNGGEGGVAALTKLRLL